MTSHITERELHARTDAAVDRFALLREALETCDAGITCEARAGAIGAPVRAFVDTVTEMGGIIEVDNGGMPHRVVGAPLLPELAVHYMCACALLGRAYTWARTLSADGEDSPLLVATIAYARAPRDHVAELTWRELITTCQVMSLYDPPETKPEEAPATEAPDACCALALPVQHTTLMAARRLARSSFHDRKDALEIVEENTTMSAALQEFDAQITQMRPRAAIEEVLANMRDYQLIRHVRIICEVNEVINREIAPTDADEALRRLAAVRTLVRSEFAAAGGEADHE